LRALLVALAAFVMLGLIDGALGVAWPTMRTVFDRDLSELGLLLAAGSTGYLTASLAYGWLHRRAGTGLLLGVGTVLLLVGVTGIALAPAWAALPVSAVVLGIGGGLVDTGMNAHAALAFDVGSINLLHACYGIGATLGPVVITVSLVSTNTWRAGYLFMAAIQAIAAMAVWRRRHQWAGAEPDLTGSDDAGGDRMALIFHLLLFFLYTGVEVGVGQWAFTLLSEGRGIGTAAAGVWVAVYWGGLTVGRLLFGVAGGRVAPTSALHGSVAVALVGLGILWLDPWGLGVLGLPVAGLGLAAVFPMLVTLTPARIGLTRSTRSMGYQLAAANLGAAVLPWTLGLVAQARGLEALGPGLFVVGVLLATVHLLAELR
jgi:fucose permease